MRYRRESADILFLSATAAFHSAAGVDHAHVLPPDDVSDCIRSRIRCESNEIIGFLTGHSLFGLNVIGALHLSKELASFIHACDQIIAVSELQRENLHARMGRLSNVTIVSNGIDPDVFSPAGHPLAG
jgi:glycosyltransferase involved in cell wall biosynthesis